VQTCIWPSGCHFHSLSLASVKSRLVLPFWYRLTWVVLAKGPLNVCVCVLWKALEIIQICYVWGKNALQISEKISLSHKLSQVLLALGDHLSEVMTKIVTIISGEPFSIVNIENAASPCCTLCHVGAYQNIWCNCTRATALSATLVQVHFQFAPKRHIAK